MNEDLIALATLVHCGGNAATRRALLERHGSPERCLRAGAGAWRASGLSETQVAALRCPDADALARTLAWLEHPAHHLIGWHDVDYPPLLARCAAPPLALFVEGDPTLLWHAGIAVVGSRAATPGGRDHAREFAREFARAGLVVASGLAAGIDRAAHEGALEVDGGLTVAVLGTGPDVAYPAAHAGLRDRIASHGAVVSEYLPGTRPRTEHFPSRNRILAGLSLGTLVVEAAERSGALITARLAGEAGREVFAVPGSIRNPMARGCHRLIRDGAALVASAEEVVQGLAPVAAELAECLRGRLAQAPPRPHPGASDASEPIEAHLKPLWLALDHDPTPMDCLVERTGLTAAEVSSMLLAMELDGRVAVEHGRYRRKT